MEKKKHKVKHRKRKKSKLKELGITKKLILIDFIFSLVISTSVLILTRNIIGSIVAFFAGAFLVLGYIVARIKLKESQKIKKMESVFPDFLQLMSSNLRAGMTTDKALLLSARKEFYPLDQEILKLGKDLVTGKNIETALLEMSHRINSRKIQKTITLIVSGIRSGGNIAVLLEETAANMRERNFVEKRAASNVLMYVLFIFFATAVGAPALFGLSSVLVEILSSLLSSIPDVETSASLPFTLTSISISPTFVVYFALVFLIATDILGSLVIGLVGQGEEKAGIAYTVPLIAASVTVFFVVRIGLLAYFGDFLG